MTMPPSSMIDIIHPYLLNGWTNFGDKWEEAIIYKNKDGLVTMEGLIIGDYTKIMFRLPEGFRPNKQLIFTVISDGEITRRLDINSNGELFLNKAGGLGSITGNGWLSLSGISFYAKH